MQIGTWCDHRWWITVESLVLGGMAQSGLGAWLNGRFNLCRQMPKGELPLSMSAILVKPRHDWLSQKHPQNESTGWAGINI